MGVGKTQRCNGASWIVWPSTGNALPETHVVIVSSEAKGG